MREPAPRTQMDASTLAQSNSLLHTLLQQPKGFLDAHVSSPRIVVEVHEPMREFPTIGQRVDDKASLLHGRAALFEILRYSIAGLDQGAIETERRRTSRTVARIATVPMCGRSEN